MANEIYNSSYWGNGVCDNTIDWGVVYKDFAGCTPSFTNTFSLSFDGVDDFLETTKTSSLITASLSMWVKVTGNFAVNERQSLASNDDFNQGRDFIIADTPTTTNDAYIGMFAGGIIYGKTSASGGIPINDGNWHHLVWTYDGSAGTSASINMYVDGQNQYSNASYSSYWSYEIKFQYFGKPTSANTYFSGSMDEVAYFNSILSSSDVTTIYNSGVPNNLDDLTTPPTAWYRNGDNGSYKSPQWLIPENSNVANSRFSNYSFEYDGIDDTVNFQNEWFAPSTPSQTTGNTVGSVSFWVKLPTNISEGGLMGMVSINVGATNKPLIWLLFYRTASSAGRYIRAYVSGANSTQTGVLLAQQFFVYDDSSTTYPNSGITFSPDTWYHIAVVHNKDATNRYKAYINGNEFLIPNTTGTGSNGERTIGEMPYSLPYNPTAFGITPNVDLGFSRTSSSGGAYYFEGNLDEVSLFNTALTSENVTAIYNSGEPTTLPVTPISHWKMGEEATFSTNWTVPDAVGSNDGTSANMTIEDRTGDAPNSTSNALSYNMTESDRETDVPT